MTTQFRDRTQHIVEIGTEQTSSTDLHHVDLLDPSDYLSSHSDRGHTTIRVTCDVSGRDETNNDYGRYKLEALFVETSAGGFVQDGSTVITILLEDEETWTCDVEENSDIIQLQLTGATGATVNWEYTASMYIMQTNANMAPPMLQIQISGMTGEESWAGLTNGTHQIVPTSYQRDSSNKLENWQFVGPSGNSDSLSLYCNSSGGTSSRRLYWYSKSTTLTASSTGAGPYLDTGAIIIDSITVGAITISWTPVNNITGDWWGNVHSTP